MRTRCEGSRQPGVHVRLDPSLPFYVTTTECAVRHFSMALDADRLTGEHARDAREDETTSPQDDSLSA